MSSMRDSRLDPEVFGLRQESLSLIRQQLTHPDLSGTAEHIGAILLLAGASHVSHLEVLIFETR
jgi:hypothetical protein